jgi:Ni/Co efflux regulator RcnB
MKRLIAAAMALSLLGGTAAEAAPYFHRDAHPGRHVVHYGPRHGGFVGPRHHVWVRGERLSPRFGNYVVVNDWRFHHLRRPPHGYHWVRYGNDYVLSAIATGLILDVMLHNAYGY